jgi:phenylpropionate dioxygenase-like ring-hydroxylating dioxygenase large terminal subunit
VFGWIPVCSAEEVPDNEVKPISLYSHDLILFRRPDTKQVRVMNAYCPHLGAHLGFGGQIVTLDNGSACLRCPFHGWQFDCDSGQLMTTKSNVGQPTIDLDANQDKGTFLIFVN